MGTTPAKNRLLSGVIACLLLVLPTALHAQTNQSQAPVVVETEGLVHILRAGSTAWIPAATNQVLLAGDRLRTGARSRATVRISDRTTKRLGELTIIEIADPAAKGGALQLLKGLLYFFHRDKPGTFPVRTPTAYAVVLGTEFNVEVADDGTTTFHIIDGTVLVSNEFGRTEAGSGQTVRSSPGQPPARTASLQTVNVIQWALYYPAILDLNEAGLDAATESALKNSIAAYRAGDLLGALDAYPTARTPASDAERIYLAELLLNVGKVDESESLLSQAPNNELAEALRTLIAAVKLTRGEALRSPSTATAFLGESYYAQSQGNLADALQSARSAIAKSPQFGFAWARLAELEFGFGNIAAADHALKKAIELTPRNAAALTMQGFVLAAQNKIQQAQAAFDKAIALDGALGNAWLGRGLCKMRQGQTESGVEDLQVAATVEPQRAIFRSYLGKGFAAAGDKTRATDELRLAREFDPNDPTAFLYSALLLQRQNRINQAIRDLEKSEDLNQNRALYRSSLLLDQDRAMREANLANIYEDAGMQDVAARKASRAVEFDPGNYSAHLFLGNSFQRQRDLKGVNQRFETPAVTEYLLANLLSPVGAGTLAQSVTDQEYSKLFERNGFGVSSATEYFSNGDWLESAAQYGTFDNTSYAISAYHRSDNGQRPNNDFRQTELSFQIKQQLTYQDSLYVRGIYGDAEGGDVVPRYDPGTANTGFRFRERQEPLLLTGYHHEWGPGIHTLLLGGWFRDDAVVKNSQQPILVFGRDGSGAITDVLPTSIEQHYHNDANLFTIEAQQIFQREKQALIFGGRYQAGTFETENTHTNAAFIFPFLFPTDTQAVENNFERWSAYGYYHLRPIEPLLLVAGLTYDRIRFPENFRFAPVSDKEDTEDQLSPKAGLIWTPLRGTTIRAGYSQSLGGVGFDQSFRLEPSQIAGFNQSFRSLIPESVAGANVATPFETYAVSLEQDFPTGTYVALGGEILRSDVDRKIGVYDFSGFTVTSGATREELDYKERAILVTLNQLVGRDWSFGVRYRLSDAELQTDLTDIPASAAILPGFSARQDLTAVLHNLNLFTIYNHPSGFFAQAQGLWYAQHSQGYSPDLRSDDFWQINLFAGWRFLDRRLEVRVGVLNLADQDYRLNPISLAPELPRDRMFTASLKFTF